MAQHRSVTRAAVAIALIAVAFVVMAPQAVADPAWSISPIVDPAGASRSFLFDVACPSATNCFAVGVSDLGPLVEHWNGSSWTIMSTPRPARSRLEGIACLAAANCFAVGSRATTGGNTMALVMHWNGSRWVTMTTPHPAGSSLSQIACPGPRSCFAVGNRPATGGKSQPTAQHWDGTRWMLMSTPIPSGNGAALSAISCPSATSCFAMGNRTTSGNEFKAFAERWNGSKWVKTPVVNPSKWTFTFLDDVSCTSATSCVAVGSVRGFGMYPDFQPLVERWNGTQWSVVGGTTPPGTPVGASLLGVSCPAPNRCFAVGDVGNPYVGGSGMQTLVETWDGNHWSVVASPTPSASEGTLLSSVSCPSATACTAVGDDATTSGYSTVAETYG